MLYIYLSHSNRQVILPTAVGTGPDEDDSPVVTFIDASGAVVASFLRVDLAVFSTRNLGPILPRNAAEQSERPPANCP
jgi:hypothetical protein